jgi:hypothetical protein
VLRMCIDEFTKNLFVVTKSLNLLRFVYASIDNKPSDNLADMTFLNSASLAEFEPNTSTLIDIQFV